jgi:hypothetical protein
MKIIVNQKAPEGGKPNEVAIDPSGEGTAIGYYGQTAASILDTRTLDLLFRADSSGLSSDDPAEVADFSTVAWSSDGTTLLVGGQARGSTGQAGRGALLRRFDPSGHRMGPDIVVPGSVADVARCGEGFVFDAGNPSVLGFISTRGGQKILQGPHGAAMRGKVGSAFTLRSDASAVRFGLGEGDDRAVIFDVTARSLIEAPTVPLDFASPRIVGLPITQWNYDLEPKLSGAKLALDEDEESHVLAVHPDSSGFALGTWWNVKAYDSSGKLLWSHASPTDASGINISANGELVVVAYDDGTIRWLRWSDGQELLALFVEAKSRKWVAWTPSGYYMASAGGEDLIGWQVNRGWEQEAEFFYASQFRAEYNRPDIVQLTLRTKDEGAAVRQANASAQREAATPIDALRSPSGLPIDRLDVLADGQKVSATGFETSKAPNARGHLVVTVPRRSEDLALVAHSGDLTSAPVKISLVYDGQPAPSSGARGQKKLYMVLAGVTGYKDPGYNNIHFAADDAKSIAETFKAQEGGPLYGHIEPRVIDDPTHDGVFDGLYWLRDVMQEDDIAVIFLSGHGYLDEKGRFWFLTREADQKKLQTTAISNDQLLEVIASIRGKKVIFIDACHAAEFLPRAPGVKGDSESTPDMNKLVNDFSAAGSGLVVFGASEGKESALEPRTPEEEKRWEHHSAYAEALIEAVGQGKASDGGGEITISLLDHYLLGRVAELTANRQHPVMSRPASRFSACIGLAVAGEPWRDGVKEFVVRRLSCGASLVIACLPVSAQTTLGWPDVVDRLANQRSQAEACVALLKDAGDKPTIAQARIVYGQAKAASDGVIAGLEVGLVKDYGPERLTRIEADLDAAGAGLQNVCNAAKQAAEKAAGTKGIVSDIVKAAVEPVIGVIKDGLGTVWARQIQEDKAEKDSIKGQLEAAKWADFGP